MQHQDQRKKSSNEMEFFTEHGDANRYKILEIIGKGSYGVVCSAIDTHTGEKVAIKKIKDIFEHNSDAIRILREIKLLRLLRHPDIVEIKRIMLPSSRQDFRDIYVVFELMESDLHQVIKANDDLTHEHQQFFLYQMLRALKYMHSANVYHRDLKPKNILANANCKLKICDFGLARVAFNDAPMANFWTDYVATRWYRAPELCGSFSSKGGLLNSLGSCISVLRGNCMRLQHIPGGLHCCIISSGSCGSISQVPICCLQYTPAIDIWSIGCIFVEVLTGKPLFPGKSVVHQLDLITNLLGTPSADTISGVRNEKARKYLAGMRKKHPMPFAEKFPKADPASLNLLKKLLAFDPKDRPTAEVALADPYFTGLAKIDREPSCLPISKLEFEFERRSVTKEDVQELIFREILEYHPQLLKDYMTGNNGMNFLYPSGIGHFRTQFAYLEENGGKSGPMIPPQRKHASLPRSAVSSTTIHPNTRPIMPRFRNHQNTVDVLTGVVSDVISGNLSKISQLPPQMPNAKLGRVMEPVIPYENVTHIKEAYIGRVHVHNAVLPQSIYQNFSTIDLAKDQEKYRIETEMESSRGKQEPEQSMPVRSTDGNENKVQPHQHLPPKPTPGMNVELNSNPCYVTHSKSGLLNSQLALNVKMLQAQSQCSAAGAAVQFLPT